MGIVDQTIKLKVRAIKVSFKLLTTSKYNLVVLINIDCNIITANTNMSKYSINNQPANLF